MNNRAWTEEEQQLLKKYYDSDGPSYLVTLLSGRSHSSIVNQAHRLGLRKKTVRFTTEEEQLILDHYALKGAKWTAQKLGRSYSSVTSKAIKLGVKVAHPNGPCQENVRYIGCGSLSGSYWIRLKWGATNRGLVFDIPIEYGWSLFQIQEEKCNLTGLHLRFSTNANGKDCTASLDRIDSSKGYIEGNVQWIHKDINRMKWNWSDEQFINLCKLVVRHSDSL